MAYEAIDRHVEAGQGRQDCSLLQRQRRATNRIRSQNWRSNRTVSPTCCGDLASAKGDRVFIFMPRTPELYFSLLGALKVGAVVGPLFEAFMETAVKDRLLDSEAVAIVTTPALLSRVPRDELPRLEAYHRFRRRRAGRRRHRRFQDRDGQRSDEAEIEWLDREDGLILHYTSGSTGKPKGVFHVQNAMIQHYYTGQIVLDLQEDDIYWCTADPGWVTGHLVRHFRALAERRDERHPRRTFQPAGLVQYDCRNMA